MSDTHWPSGQLPKTLFDHSHAAMVTVSVDGKVMAANASFATLVERPIQTLLGTDYADLLHADDQGEFDELRKRILVGSAIGEQTLIRFQCPNGVIADGLVCVSLIQDPILAQEFFFIVIQDTSEERRTHRRLQHQASHDDLTGLVNRREFIERMARALDSCQLYGVSHTLCYVDLDDFKPINDIVGHEAGDKLLVDLTELLTKVVRTRDTVARLGGDEFALLLENCPLDEGEKIALKVCNRLADSQFDIEGRSFKVGASVGVVAVTVDSQSVSDVMQLADMACYAAKDLGKNQVHVLRSRSVIEPEASILRLDDWMTAFNEQRLQLAAQPIVSLKSDGVTSANGWQEILLRIMDERGNQVSPRLVIPVSERYGKMPQIDRWVIEQSIAFCSRLMKQNKPAMLSINLSATSLADQSLCDFVQTQIARYSVKAEYLCFEITETAAVRNIDLARLLVSRIKALGCRFALDDFGAGVSSLRYLDELQIDYLKIDSQFVRKLAHELEPQDSPASAGSKQFSQSVSLPVIQPPSNMVNAIQQMALALNLETVAEEVESQKVADSLTRLGVTYAQGYFYGKPAIIK